MLNVLPKCMALSGSTNPRAPCSDTKSFSHFMSGSRWDDLLSGQTCQVKPG